MTGPLIELGFGTLFLTLIILIHGIGLQKINGHFASYWSQVTVETPHWRSDLVLAIAVAALTVLHLFETFVWALPLHGFGMIPSWRDTYYFVLENYTTLGEGNVTLPAEWRLLGPIIATSGLFTFGWTTGVLVSIMTEFGQLAKQRSHARAAGSAIRDG